MVAVGEMYTTERDLSGCRGGSASARNLEQPVAVAVAELLLLFAAIDEFTGRD